MTTSQDMIRGRSNVVTLTNNSGGGLVAGDVCIQDTTADEKATTTTSAADTKKVFVAAETIANGAAGKFYESGYCPLVNVNASVTRGHFLFTHTVAKQATGSATYAAGAFGKILKSGTTPSAVIYSQTAQVSGGIEVKEADGSPDVTGVTQIIVTNGTLTDNTGGSVSIAIGGGGASTADPFIIGKGTAADLSAAIQIPGLSGHPDKKVGGVNDDEFDALSGWTTLGALDTLNVTDFASNVHIKKNTSGTQVDGIYKALSGAFTMTAKMTAYDFSQNYHTPGIMIGEASPGKLATWGPQFGSSNIIELNPWTNRTTRGTQQDFSCNYPTLGYGTMPLYLQIVVHSDTNVDFGISVNGYLYRLLKTAYNPGFTIGSVGLCVMGFGAIPAEAVFDWVRFV